MKILTILGARPQFIKAGSVSREIAKYDDITEVILHTGQHYDANMSDIFFDEMKIPKPNYFLGIGGKSHGVMTGQMIEKIEEIALKEKPDWMLVYGDTNSTLAGALVASKLHVDLAHIEAGLRSFNVKMPEEINRILTDRISQKLFCPTKTAVNNLKNEGFDNFECQVFNVGDVMYEGALYYKQFARKPKLDIQQEFVLCTVHRAENTNSKEKLNNIFDSLTDIAKDKRVLLPLHPRTKKILNQFEITVSKNIDVIEPVGYLEMVWLLDNCQMVITDSGGLQKEAYFFQKPCITLREETEWVELCDNKFNILVGTNKEIIVSTYYEYKSIFNNDYKSSYLYGDGKSSIKIIEEIQS